MERYKEKKPKAPTIAEKFNTYKFWDYREQIIDLLMRVCTVSVETMKIVKEMPEQIQDASLSREIFQKQIQKSKVQL